MVALTEAIPKESSHFQSHLCPNLSTYNLALKAHVLAGVGLAWQCNWCSLPLLLRSVSNPCTQPLWDLQRRPIHMILQQLQGLQRPTPWTHLLQTHHSLVSHSHHSASVPLGCHPQPTPEPQVHLWGCGRCSQSLTGTTLLPCPPPSPSEYILNILNTESWVCSLSRTAAQPSMAEHRRMHGHDFPVHEMSVYTVGNLIHDPLPIITPTHVSTPIMCVDTSDATVMTPSPSKIPSLSWAPLTDLVVQNLHNQSS